MLLLLFGDCHLAGYYLAGNHHGLEVAVARLTLRTGAEKGHALSMHLS